MKDLLWGVGFLLAIGAYSLLEDYRAERCLNHGDRWVERKGCSDPKCVRRGQPDDD